MSRAPELLHVFPTFGVGGAEMLIVSIINKLGGEFRHAFLALRGDYSAMDRIDPGIEIRRVEAPPRKGPIQFPLVLRDTAHEAAPDLICTYNWAATDLLIGARIGSRCRFIHSEHGFGDDEADKLAWRRVWTRRLLLNSIYATIVPSETLVKIALEEFGIAESKLRLIQNGVDTERFINKINLELRRKLGFVEGEIVFGFIGALRPEKNLGLLIEAFAKSKVEGAKLLIVGEGGCRSDLERMVSNHNVQHRVIFAGRRENTAEYYQALDVFCMSSKTEQQSIALLEAMASGLPCITTDVGDSKQLLCNPGAPWVVPKGSADQYAQSIRTVATDSELRKALGTANRTRCQSLYSLERTAQAYRALWLEALA